MRVRKAVAVLVLSRMLCINAPTLAQIQTTGRIRGTVTDEKGAVIVGAEVIAISRATGEERKVITDRAGNFAVSLLPSSTYLVSVTASGFKKALFDNVKVAITETTTINAELAVGAVLEASVMVNTAPSLVQTDGPQRGRVVDSRAVSGPP